MRITTNAIIRNYKSNLASSMSSLNTARDKVMTGRQFVSADENPAGSLRSSVLERKYVKNLDHISSAKDAQSYLDSQESAAMQISDLAKTLTKQYGLEALNGTTGSVEIRKTYADAWRNAQDSLLLSMNASYEGKYVFAGSDGKNPPFSLSVDPVSGKQILTYRGKDVNDPANNDILESLSNDTTYIDLGFGLTTVGGEIDPSSAFNTSIPGINMIGYGKDDQGNSNNMILLCGEIADALETEPFDKEKYELLLNKFENGRNTILESVTTLGTKSSFLENSLTRLEDNKLSLATQLDSVVNIDMAEAITQFSWAQYAYNAALKVGTNILTPSFIDFMH